MGAAPKSSFAVTGGCHCAHVRFEIDVDDAARIGVSECNCSICHRSGYLHLIVPASRFRLVAGKDRLASYRFNTGTANHLFCSVCGIKAFYVPRSHPDGYSVNARCLDPPFLGAVVVEQQFDGRHWERHVHELPKLRS
jgi:hypothetical protein